MATIRRSVKYFDTENPILPKGDVGFEIETSRIKVGDGINGWLQIEYHPSSPVISWTAFLNQTGTANATAQILSESLYGVVISRGGVGTTLLTKVGGFPAGKSVPKKILSHTDEVTGDKFVLTPVSEDVYKLETYAAVNTDVLADGVLVDFYLNLEVYL